jgi:hypothetical protein
VTTEAGTLGHLFAGKPDQDAGGMELRTGDANHRHGENHRALGDYAQRQFGSPALAPCTTEDKRCASSPSLQCPALPLASP